MLELLVFGCCNLASLGVAKGESEVLTGVVVYLWEVGRTRVIHIAPNHLLEGTLELL